MPSRVVLLSGLVTLEELDGGLKDRKGRRGRRGLSSLYSTIQKSRLWRSTSKSRRVKMPVKSLQNAKGKTHFETCNSKAKRRQKTSWFALAYMFEIIKKSKEAKRHIWKNGYEKMKRLTSVSKLERDKAFWSLTFWIVPEIFSDWGRPVDFGKGGSRGSRTEKGIVRDRHIWRYLLQCCLAVAFRA